jgi:hypothetical protein
MLRIRSVLTRFCIAATFAPSSAVRWSGPCEDLRRTCLSEYAERHHRIAARGIARAAVRALLRACRYLEEARDRAIDMVSFGYVRGWLRGTLDDPDLEAKREASERQGEQGVQAVLKFKASARCVLARLQRENLVRDEEGPAQ